MLLLKIAVLTAFVLIGVMLYETWRHARAQSARAASLSTHRRLGRKTLAATLAAVVLTEVLVRSNGGLKQDILLLCVHFVFAAPFLLLLIGQQWLHGFKMPTLHRVLGYSCFVLYTGTVTSGSVLLYNT